MVRWSEFDIDTGVAHSKMANVIVVLCDCQEPEIGSYDIVLQLELAFCDVAEELSRKSRALQNGHPQMLKLNHKSRT